MDAKAVRLLGALDIVIEVNVFTVCNNQSYKVKATITGV